MQVTRNEDAELTLLRDMYSELHDPDRHQPSVSGMIYCLTKNYYENVMTPPNVDGTQPNHINRQTLLYFVTGLGLEKVLLISKQIAEKGDFEGISWHLDHLGDDGFMEIKSTRGGLPKEGQSLEDYIHEGWRKQMLAYWKANGITSGQLAVLHLIQADLRVYDISATQKEIDDNWTWIQQRAITYLKFVREGKPPTPFEYNMNWECRTCTWKVLCDARKAIGN
jgi:hypothetical protein